MSQQGGYEEGPDLSPTPAEYIEALAVPVVRSVVAASARTIVCKFRPTLFAGIGSSFQLELTALGSDLEIIAMALQEAADSGNAWNMRAAGVAVLYGGAATFTIPAGTTITTDDIALPFDKGRPLMLGFEVGAGAVLTYAAQIGAVSYYKTGVSEAADASKGASYVAQPGIAYLASRFMVAA